MKWRGIPSYKILLKMMFLIWKEHLIDILVFLNVKIITLGNPRDLES